MTKKQNFKDTNYSKHSIISYLISNHYIIYNMHQSPPAVLKAARV